MGGEALEIVENNIKLYFSQVSLSAEAWLEVGSEDLSDL